MLYPALEIPSGADLVIVNGENSAPGNGMTPDSARAIFDAGADVITGGNHTWRRREVYSYLDDEEYVIRPANYPDAVPGHGWCIADAAGRRVLIINLAGCVYTMHHLSQLSPKGT